MPNYVKAKLQVSGENPKELIDSLCEVCKDGHKRFDFNKIIPMPDELRICCGGPTENCMKLLHRQQLSGRGKRAACRPPGSSSFKRYVQPTQRSCRDCISHNPAENGFAYTYRYTKRNKTLDCIMRADLLRVKR